MSDLSTGAGSGATPIDHDRVLRICAKIRARWSSKAEDIIQVAKWIYEAFANRLPLKDYGDYNLGIKRGIAKELRAVGRHPWMTDKKNVESFPDNVDDIISLFWLLRHLERHGLQQRFLDRMKDETINPEMFRSHIRQLKDLDGRTEQQIRDERIRVALADPTFRTGFGIYTADFRKLDDLVKDNSVDLWFVDAEWNDTAIHHDVSALAFKKVQPSGLYVVLCGNDQYFDVLRISWERFLPMSGYHLFHTHRKKRRYISKRSTVLGEAARKRNEHYHLQPVLIFYKPPEPEKFPLVGSTTDYKLAHKDKLHHEWDFAEENAIYYLRHLTKRGALIVDAFAGGGTISAACARLGDRTCIATEKDHDTAVAARKRVWEIHQKS